MGFENPVHTLRSQFLRPTASSIWLLFAVFVPLGLAQRPTTNSRCGDAKQLSISAKDARGQPWNLHQGHASLYAVAFVQMHPDTEASESRRQALVLASVVHQNRGRGLGGILIDYAQSRSPASDEAQFVSNAYYDWNLADVTFLPDPQGLYATFVDIRAAPTVLLLNSLGCVMWFHVGPVSSFELGTRVAEALKTTDPKEN